MRFLTRRGLSDEQRQVLDNAAQVTFLPMENIGEQGELNCSTIRDIDDVENGYTRFFDGDILVAKITPCFENGKGALVRNTLNGVGFGTTELHVLTAGTEIDARYLYYITASDHFRRLGEAAMFGAAGQKRVPEDFVRDYSFPVPPLPQQSAIAEYLDRETARLDTLLDAKQRLLELLSEKRQAIVTCAVTGDLDALAHSTTPATILENSDSDINAVRDAKAEAVVGGGCGVTSSAAKATTSEHKLKYLVSINDDVLPEDTDPDSDLQYIDISNVDSSGRILEMASYRFEDAPSRARRLVQEGDVIISTVRTYLRAITHIHEPPDNLVVSTGFAVVRPLGEGLDAHYCGFALRNSTFLAEIERRSVGVSYPAINANDLADIPIPVHPLPKQRAIADYLDRETTRLDTLTTQVSGSIVLLRERRAALISAAATGKVSIGDNPCR